MTTMYHGSKGPVAISTMTRPHAANALAKLERSEPGRTEEIEALRAHVARLDEEYAEAQASSATDEGPAPVGHNMPPEDEEVPVDGQSFDALKVHADDLLTEARNWADGAAIESDAQAAEVARLIRNLQKAGTLLDGARMAEKQPLDDQIAEIQERYNAYIAGLKGKHSKPGTITRALSALNTLAGRWMLAKEAERRAQEEAAKAEAQRLADEARAAQATLDASDLGAMEAAAEVIDQAVAAQRDAERIAKQTVTLKASDGSRALGFRTSYRAEVTDPKACLLHYWSTNRAPLLAALAQLAQQDVNRKVMTIPGVTVHEQRAVA